jgi:hypothetical protein
MTTKDFSTDGLRSFTGQDSNVYYIKSPTADDIRGADWEYSKIFTKSLSEGIMTQEELKDVLRVRGIIGPEYDQRAEELAMILANKISILESVVNDEEKSAAAIEVANARDDLFAWNQRLQAPLANTCEQMADDARIEYLTSKIIVNSLGTKVWENFDAYLTEADQSKQQAARFEVMVFLQGLDSDFLENTPEAVAMREVQTNAIADAAAELAEVELEEKAEAEKEKKNEEVKKTKKRKPAKK